MRQPNPHCVADFLARGHAQSSELVVLSSQADYTNGEVEFCAALHTLKQLLDLFDSLGFVISAPINHQPALKACIICRAMWFNCSNQNAASAQVTERLA